MKKLISLFLIAFCLSGCMERKESVIKQEKAEVIQLSYIPSQISSVTGGGPSLNSDGKMGYAFISGTQTSEEVWAVVFRCAEHHMTFALKSKEIYDQVKAGQEVILNYVEVIEFDKNKPGSERVVDYKTKSVDFA